MNCYLSTNGIAKDSVTGLEWQDDSSTATVEKDWKGAQQYCQNLRLSSYKDWRLPNIYELSTIVNNSKNEEPYIIDGFKNIASDGYWSSITNASDTNYAWVLGFNNGSYDSLATKNMDYHFRCTRGKQLSFNDLSLLSKKGKLKVSQNKFVEIDPDPVRLAQRQAQEQAQNQAEYERQAQKRAQEQAEYERQARAQAEYDRKHVCDGLYQGKAVVWVVRGLTVRGQITGVGNGYASAKVTKSDAYDYSYGDVIENNCQLFR